MGRVDGILLDQQGGHPARLSAILIGPAALAFRLHPRLGRVVGAVERYFGLAEGRPARIDFANVEDAGRTVRVRLAIGETAVEAVEQRLRAWVTKIPGSR